MQHNAVYEGATHAVQRCLCSVFIHQVHFQQELYMCSMRAIGGCALKVWAVISIGDRTKVICAHSKANYHNASQITIKCTCGSQAPSVSVQLCYSLQTFAQAMCTFQQSDKLSIEVHPRMRLHVKSFLAVCSSQFNSSQT